MAATPSYGFTITRVARMPGKDEDKLEQVAVQMDPEDGRLSGMDLEDDVATTVCIAIGIANLKQLLDDYKPYKASE